MVASGSPFAGLATVILVITAIALVTGAALAGTDLLNFITNTGKAKAQSEIDAVDLKYYEPRKAAETEAAIEKINIDSALYADKVKNELDFITNFRLVLVYVGGLSMIGLVTVLLVSLFRKLNPSIQPGVSESNLWQNPNKRALERERARQMERIMRSRGPDF
jgi:hypothetical protein